jgi:hypothetical protein
VLVHLAELGDNPILDDPVRNFQVIASEDSIADHRLTDDPGRADLILFVQCHMLADDWSLAAIREHPLARRFPRKVMVYDERDRPWCVLPGVYVSMPGPRFLWRYQRPWAYYNVPPGDEQLEPDLLFSFIASPSNPARRPLYDLSHPDAIVEKVKNFSFYDPSSADFEARRLRFREVLSRSRFVLCPRGRGTSSIRLYEALALGRVPVIISDDWVPPPGPDWDAFSLRWPENRMDGLVETLQARDDEWAGMSAGARAAYARFFSPAASFHNVVSLCAELLEAEAHREFPHGGVRDRAWLHAARDSYSRRATGALRSRGGRVVRALRRS